MMNSFDAFTVESESNLALGYVMAAQLHVRHKKAGNLTLASEMIDAGIELHPQFYNAILGLRQEIHYRNYSFGGPPWLFGGTGTLVHLKNPWFFIDIIDMVGRWCRLHYFLDCVKDAAYTWPLTALFLRKV